MTWPRPTREAHERFCIVEGWRRIRSARGGAGTHHVTYELALPDGRVLRTRNSRPVDRSDYGKALWGHILRDQLDVGEAEFWACVCEGEPPQRGSPIPPAESLPADLVHLLISRVRLDESQVAAMSRDEALARLQRYWRGEG
ncbi:hypothetical protein GCM10027570_54230 [Streptomonospora sediminis]